MTGRSWPIGAAQRQQASVMLLGGVTITDDPSLPLATDRFEEY
jgi:hypothetical protein